MADKVLFNPFDVVEDASVSLADLSPELRSTFKLMLKKDLSSRLRGLAGLKAWIEGLSGEEEFAMARDQFVRVYAMSVVDPERQIRQGAHECLLKVVKRDRKWLSPVVKRLFYPWIGSLHDPVEWVGTTALQALTICFGTDRIPEVCSTASKTVLQKSWDVLCKERATLPADDEDAALARAFEMSHALNAVTFLISHCRNADVKESSVVGGTSQICAQIEAEGNDAILHAALYKLLAVALQKDLVGAADVQSAFNMILRDLGSSCGTQSINLLRVLRLDTVQTGLLCQALESALGSEIQRGAIGSLEGVVKAIPLKSDRDKATRAIWNVLKSYRSVDTVRHLALWSLLISCLGGDDCDLFGEAMDFVLHPSPQARAIRPELLKMLAGCNAGAFEGKLAAFLNSAEEESSSKLAVIMELSSWHSIDSFESIALEAFNGLSREERERIIGQVLRLSSNADIFVAMIDSYIQQANEDYDQLAELLGALTVESHPNVPHAISELSGSLGALPVERRTAILGRLIESHPNLDIAIDKDAALEACRSPLTPTLVSLIARAVQALIGAAIPSDLHGRLSTCAPNVFGPLMTIAMRALQEDDKSCASAFIAYLCLQLDLLAPTDLHPAVGHIHDLGAGTATDMLQRLLTVAPELAGEALALELDRRPALNGALSEHLGRTAALCSCPILCGSWDTAGEFWKDDALLDRLIVICAKMVQQSQSELDMALLVAAVALCRSIERQYVTDCSAHAGSLYLTLLDALRQAQDTLGQVRTSMTRLLRESGGVYYLLAQTLGIKVPVGDLLASDCSLETALLVDPNTRLELSDDLHPDAARRLLFACSNGYEWSRNEIFQLMASAELDVKGHRALTVAVKFVSDTVRRESLNIKEAYWQGHSALLEAIIDATLGLFDRPGAVWKGHVHLQQMLAFSARLLDFESLRDIVSRRADPFWRAFTAAARLEGTAANASLISAFSTPIGRLGSCAAPSDETCALLFQSRFPDAKLACRTLLVQPMDTYLERARIRLDREKRDTMQEEESFEVLRESLLIPWRPLKDVLLTQRDGNDGDGESKGELLDEYFALDLFMCLAEGSKEEQNLAGSYATFFRDHLATKFLCLLAGNLGWLGSSSASDVPDLSRVEFTIYSGDFSREPLCYAANLLFRCIKAFPAAIRSWHGGLSREQALSFTRCCRRFMSPLLIERELQRIRRGSQGPLQLKVGQTSTSCTVSVRYQLEEFAFSLQLALPPEYPLQPVGIEGGERLGISETKWRAWMLSVQTLLGQNLAIIQVVQQWRANAERALEGVEPCSICYCVLQPSDRALPGPSCKTCRNKFHSACLYRWFKTGGSATCPMCRSLF